MSGAYQTLNNLVLVAGEERHLNIHGRFFSVIDGSHPDIKIRLDDGAEMVFDEGLYFEMPPGERFSKVTMRNTHATDTMTFTVAYGFGRMVDSRLSLVGGALPVEPAGGSPEFAVVPGASNAPFSVQPDGANNPFNVTPRVSLAAADYDVTIGGGSTSTALGSSDPHIARRKAVTVTNAGAGDLWVRANNSAGKIGVRIAPGETHRFETQAALYVHNPNGFAVRWSALAEFWT